MKVRLVQCALYVTRGSDASSIHAHAKSHMLSASRRQPHLLHVSAVDRSQTWSMDKSWRCVTLSGFLHSHIVRCRWKHHFLWHALQWPRPVQKRFSSDHWRLWRSKPGSHRYADLNNLHLSPGDIAGLLSVLSAPVSPMSKEKYCPMLNNTGNYNPYPPCCWSHATCGKMTV